MAMDIDRFDRIARIAGAAGSRRRALAGLVGAALGLAALPAIVEQDASVAAKKRKCKPKCGPGQRCVRKQCVCDAGLACGSSCCTDGEGCFGGVCQPCTIVSSGDPDADGAALKALVQDPAGPDPILVCPGLYRLQSTVPGPSGMIEVRRSVAIIGRDPAGSATLNCGTMQVQNICLKAVSDPGADIAVVLAGIDVTGPGLEPLESHGVVAAGVSAWGSATLILDSARIGGFSTGVLGWTDGRVSLEGGVRVTGNGNGILNTGGADAVTCAGEGNAVTGNDPGPTYADCTCVSDPEACGCGRLGPCTT